MAVSYTPINHLQKIRTDNLKKNQKAKMLGFKKMLSKKCMQTEQNMGIDEVEKDVQILSGHTVAVIIEKRIN